MVAEADVQSSPRAPRIRAGQLAVLAVERGAPPSPSRPRRSTLRAVRSTLPPSQAWPRQGRRLGDHAGSPISHTVLLWT